MIFTVKDLDDRMIRKRFLNVGIELTQRSRSGSEILLTQFKQCGVTRNKLIGKETKAIMVISHEIDSIMIKIPMTVVIAVITWVMDC